MSVNSFTKKKFIVNKWIKMCMMLSKNEFRLINSFLLTLVRWYAFFYFTSFSFLVPMIIFCDQICTVVFRELSNKQTAICDPSPI